MLARFVDIGGMVDHHCLNFLFVKNHQFIVICEHNEVPK